MISKFKELLKKLHEWDYLGNRETLNSAGAIQIGHVPERFPKGYLHTYFSPLSCEKITFIEDQLDFEIPQSLRDFFLASNGLKLFLDDISVYGLKISYERSGNEAIQPFDIIDYNTHHRLITDEDKLLFGGYSKDGSQVYINHEGLIFQIDSKGNQVNTWDNIWDWLILETKKISALHDNLGNRIKK